MKQTMTAASVAALALLAGISHAAAQGFDRQGPGDAKGGAPTPPAAAQPPQQKMPQGPQAAPQVAPKAPRGAEERGAARERGPDPDKRTPERRSSDRDGGKAQPKQAIEKDRQGDQRSATENAKQKQRENDKRQAAEKDKTDKTRNAAERGGSDTRQQPQPKTAEPKQPGSSDGQKSAGREQLRQERARLTDDQRSRMRRGFLEHRQRGADLNIRVHIGAALPRRVSLYAVPAAVVAIFPRYRAYRYVLVDDTICIVDPATYEVVDIIDEGSRGPADRPRMAELSLSERERSIVLDAIPSDFPNARLRLRLALGASIPEDTRLFEFAPVVLGQIPKLRDYRFVVSDDQVVVVMPSDRSIAMVIDR